MITTRTATVLEYRSVYQIFRNCQWLNDLRVQTCDFGYFDHLTLQGSKIVQKHEDRLVR